MRDGTYLIGTTAIITQSDVPMLFQSHIYRLRVLDPDRIDPWLLFACLNTPVVKRQIRAKQFTQDIIDTLGKRIFEVILPIPKDKRPSGENCQEKHKRLCWLAWLSGTKLNKYPWTWKVSPTGR